MISNMYKPGSDNRLPARTHMMFIIYVAIFGVTWGVGTSILALTLPSDLFTRGILITWFEVIILFLTKLVVRHPLSVTIAILIAASISIFTFSFGPPNPFKPLFVFSGLAFDAGTLFRTKTLRRWNLYVGLFCYLCVIYPTFLLTIWLMDPGAYHAVLYGIPFHAAIYSVEGAIAATVLWQYLRPDRAPGRVKEIWRRIGRE
jgi:hypothetical protein